MGSSILIFLITQGDDIFVGKLLGTTALGLYQLAYRISNMPATEITHVISQVTFPAYSKLQDNLPKLREAYLRTLQFTAFLSIPIAGLIFILAPDFTRIFLGEKWMPMVPAMQVLAIFGLMRALSGAGGQIVNAVGKPKFTTYFSAIQLAILASIIYPFTLEYGILGTSVAVIIAFCFTFIPGQIVNCRIIGLSFYKWLKSLTPATCASLIMGGIIYISKMNAGHPSILSFTLLLALAALIYTVIIAIFFKKQIAMLKQSIAMR